MREQVREALGFLRKRTERVPDAVVVLGSGLGAFGDSLKDGVVVPYGDIPHWPVSTAPGHDGKLVFGSVSGRYVAVMQGRAHYYEGYSMEQVVFPVRVFGEWKVRNYIATNAVGGIDHGLKPGDLVLIHDHINFMGDNPLIGVDRPYWNPRFPDMTYCYDRTLMAAAERSASAEGILLRRGVYIAFSGPSYETPAEIRMARLLGATVVGMSTVPEALTANAMGMRVCVISCVSNFAAGMREVRLTVEEILKEMGKASDRLIRLLNGLLREME